MTIDAVPAARPDVPRRVVCAAARVFVNGREIVVIGARNWDGPMRMGARAHQLEGDIHNPFSYSWEMGFIDQNCKFMSRELAWEVASAAHQIIRRVPHDDNNLFSENLY